MFYLINIQRQYYGGRRCRPAPRRALTLKIHGRLVLGALLKSGCDFYYGLFLKQNLNSCTLGVYPKSGCDFY